MKRRLRRFYNALLVVTTLVALVLFALSVILIDAKDTYIPGIAAIVSVSWIMLFAWANHEKYGERF